MYKQIKNVLLLKVDPNPASYGIILDKLYGKDELQPQLIESLIDDENNTTKSYKIPLWNYKVLGKLNEIDKDDVKYLLNVEDELLIEDFKQIIKDEGWIYLENETLVLVEVKICKICKEEIAVWFYMPSSSDPDRYYCDTCVPRGCSCNRYYKEDNIKVDKDDKRVKYFNDKDKEVKKKDKWQYFIHVDENGDGFPCCEYSYEENGFWF